MDYILDFTFITNVPQDMNLLEKVEALRQMYPIKQDCLYVLGELLGVVPKRMKQSYRIGDMTLYDLLQPDAINSKYRYFFAMPSIQENVLILPYNDFFDKITDKDKKMLHWFYEHFPNSEVFSIYVDNNGNIVYYLYLDSKNKELRFFSLIEIYIEEIGEISPYEEDYVIMKDNPIWCHPKNIPPNERNIDNAELTFSVYESLALNLMTKFGINMEDPAIEQLPVEVYVY